MDGEWEYVDAGDAKLNVEVGNCYVVTAIDPGEGYRLLGWKEAAVAGAVEIYDGRDWRFLLGPSYDEQLYANDVF